MDFDFSDEKLVELYTKGKSKKYKFLDKRAIDNFLDCVAQIGAATMIQDWWKRPSLNFESLEGYENRFSMRIDKKHRLEFEIDFEDEQKNKGFVRIFKISQHYK